jgi:hypothetical protein
MARIRRAAWHDSASVLLSGPYHTHFMHGIAGSRFRTTDFGPLLLRLEATARRGAQSALEPRSSEPGARSPEPVK